MPKDRLVVENMKLINEDSFIIESLLEVSPLKPALKLENVLENLRSSR